MILSAAYRIGPFEIESELMANPAVADVAVIGVPHEKWGETAKAVVVKAPGSDPTPEEIIEFSRRQRAVGVSLYPDNARDLASLLASADEAMYRVKTGERP